MSNIETTNLFLGIMAAVSLVQLLMVVTALVVVFRAYRKLSARFDEFDEQRLAPLAQKAQAVVDDVQRLTSQVAAQGERVEHAISQTAERFEERAERVRANVRRRVVPMVAAVRTFKEALRHNGSTPHDPLAAHETGASESLARETGSEREVREREARKTRETEARVEAAAAVERGEPWPAEAEPTEPQRDAYWSPGL